MHEPIDLESGQGATLALADATLTVKAGGSATGERISIIEGSFQPDGFAPLPHVHATEDESFYVLEGRFRFQIDDRRIERGAGAFVHVRPGALHGFRVAGDEPGRILIVHAPPLDRSFEAMAKVFRPGEPVDRGAVAQVMRDWGMDVPDAGGGGPQ